jgi:DNA (cytosine-5)-methyltransferase 1
MVKPTVISTFAGCGGSSLGYQMAGFHELLAVEWDQNAVDTFHLNFPDVPIYHGDIAKLTGEECMRLAGIEKGALDVLDGSPPCQGFSTAGKRKWDDPRNSLFKEYARLLNELQPKVFVMENVTGMVKGCMKQAYLTIIKTLRDCGYKAKGEVLNAMYFNVPQSRERVIIIGVREDLGIEPSHPKPQGKPITTRKALEGCIDTGKALTPEAAKYYDRMKPGESASKYHPKGHLFGLIKLNPEKPSPTLTRSAGASKVVHWEEKRFIGIKERARFASFPDSFQWSGKWTDIYNRQGNSVPPNLMRAIAEHIKTNILQRMTDVFPNIEIKRLP